MNRCFFVTLGEPRVYFRVSIVQRSINNIGMRAFTFLACLISSAAALASPPRIPNKPGQCTLQAAKQIAQDADKWVDTIASREIAANASAAAWIKHLDQLLTWQDQADQQLQRFLDMAGAFTALPDNKQRVGLIAGYLSICKTQIELAGKIRYLSRDIVQRAANRVDQNLDSYRSLIKTIARHKSSSGADTLTYALFDPDKDSDGEAFPDDIKLAILNLVATADRIELLPGIANYVKEKGQSPSLIIRAAEVIRQLGLPQDPHPKQPAWVAKPQITAARLTRIVRRLTIPPNGTRLQSRHRSLLAWLKHRMTSGVSGSEFRLGKMGLREGDWFLMKNPSPYNEFTEVSPGLFTHVGVITTETSARGIRRFVIVDLPERGSTVPAINVDAYLERTLHYAFLRHPNRRVAQKLGRVAASLIGKEAQFDLTFQTQRVERVRGKLADMKRVHTYCAGFLLLCSQETVAPGHHFFPLVERPAGGFCRQNLKKLGISLGANFVSPTGPLFSRTLRRVGMREPTYGPLRDIKNQIYSHFCAQMRAKPIRPAPNTLQLIRQNLANLARYNPWLARALAKTSNVSEHMDLAAAARAAAVIESLDGIARKCARDFLAAREAIRDSESNSLKQLPRRLRKRHEKLFHRWRKDELTPRDLRVELVRFYAKWGKSQLDKRFFPTAAP